MGQIRNLVSLCYSVCLSVSLHSQGPIFLDRLSPKVAQKLPTKVRTSSFWVNIAQSFPYLPLPQKPPFWAKRSLKSMQNKYVNCLKCSRITVIAASYRKMGSRNTTVTSDFRSKVEMRHAVSRTCIEKYAI